MSSARDFVDAHPALRQAMTTSRAFAEVRERAAVEVDEERLYIVRGDTLGDEEDLLVETLVRGAHSSDPNDPRRALYLELDDELQEAVKQRSGG